MSDLTLASYMRIATDQLKGAGIKNAGFDVRLLVMHVLNFDRADLLSKSAQSLSSEDRERLTIIMDRRAKREPVARIVGEREFWGLPFGLNEATLEPRPDSETIIETTLQLFLRSREKEPQTEGIRILDLGTGSGCLLLSLLHELPKASGLGLDIAPRATEQAELNAKRLELSERATFQTNNWLTNITERFDIIVSNPPYIRATDLEGLMPEVKDHDPRVALDGGDDGLDVYRLLIPQIKKHLKRQGVAAFEGGEGQAAIIAELMEQNGLPNTTIRNDLGGVARCVAAHIP